MRLRLGLALCALATPLFAQSLPTPNLGTGTKLNGANITTTATKGQGTSVSDPGTGNLEMLLPVQTVTGASKTFAAADLYKETRRSNSGSGMSDTFPGTGTVGLVNGARMFVNNIDTSASITITAGSGTTLNGAASIVLGPGRSSYWVYDLSATNWRPTGNSLTALLAANNLSEIASASAARGNLGVTATGGDTSYVFRSNNLSDLANAAAARTNLGLGALAILNTINNSNWSGTGLAVANGGTGQTGAAAARGPSGINVESGTGHGDSAYTILATDRWIYTNAAFTASRTWTLPAAAAVNPGAPLIVEDAQGTVTGTNALAVSRAGSDTINGSTSFTIDVSRSRLILFSDGLSKWTARLQRPYGTAAGNAVNLDNSAKLPAVDASQLTGIGLGAWSTYTPTATAGLTPTGFSATTTGRYSQSGKTVLFSITISVTANGSGSGWINVTLPPVAARASPAGAALGYNTSNNALIFGEMTTTDMNILTYSGAYPGGTGAFIVISGHYEAA